MGIKKLNEDQMRLFDSAPEDAMGLHTAGSEDGQAHIVVGGRVVITFDGRLLEELSRYPLARGERLQSFNEHADRADPVNQIELWLRQLPEFERSIWPEVDIGRSLRFKLTPPGGYAPPTPARPPHVFGHLPFTGTTGSDDVFYRCEPWLGSRRLNQTTNTISAGTYGCPASEIPFIPTGFAAVGRFALPSLFPAIYRWEIKPVSPTSLQCGASVPLYGQSGGGVEVCFQRLTHNRGPIAEPVVLPAL
jgi:hypothetical protein